MIGTKNVFRGMNKKLLVVVVLCGFVAVAAIANATGLLSWQGTISGTPSKSFSVWDNVQGGVSLVSPYSLAASPVTASMTFSFWIENDGSLPMNVSVSDEVFNNCSAFWSLPVNIAVGIRGEAVLTLTITDVFSYTWAFTPT